MTDFNQFGSAARSADASRCAQREAMLMDALDGTLTAAERADFDAHIAGCPACAERLAEAERGAAWLGILKQSRPEPPADLLERILNKTSQASRTSETNEFSETNESSETGGIADSPRLSPAPARRPSNTLLGVPSWTPWPPASPGGALPLRQRMANLFRPSSLRAYGAMLMQPRLAMTAAMAFFSIALTLNLTGVRLSSLRASDLRPSSLQRVFYATGARMARTFNNMRVVYELESRVREIQQVSDSDSAAPSSEDGPATDPTAQRPAGGAKEHPKSSHARPESENPEPGASRREAPDRHQELAGSAWSLPRATRNDNGGDVRDASVENFDVLCGGLCISHDVVILSEAKDPRISLPRLGAIRKIQRWSAVPALYLEERRHEKRNAGVLRFAQDDASEGERNSSTQDIKLL